MTNEQRFNAIRYFNGQYIKTINENAPAEVQERALRKCYTLMQEIKQAGLLQEYSEYCEKQRLKELGIG